MQVRIRIRNRLLILPVLMIAASVACDDESLDGDAQCTPPTAISLTVLVQGTNAEAFAGRPAAMRVLAADSVVMICTTGAIAVAGTIDLTGATFGPVGDARVEVVLSSDGSAAFGTGDRTYAFRLNVDGALTGDACGIDRTWTLTLDAEATPTDSVTWVPGLACPGE